MADVRALLAAEKSARRITHPHATYTKSGVLSCRACDLSIRSEALWEGHLKSTNHRKNAARIAAGQINREYHTPSSATAPGPAAPAKALKRKIEDVGEHDAQQEERDYIVDGSKKPKSRSVSAAAPGITASADTVISGFPDTSTSPNAETRTTTFRTEKPSEKHVRVSEAPSQATSEEEPIQRPEPAEPDPPQPAPAAPIDEDEWAAFESDITSLQRQSHSATISAAPLSAEQIQAQKEELQNQRKLRETEIQDEQEDERGRVQEEFEVQEEMEEKVRRLREKRESLRLTSVPGHAVDAESGEDPRSANVNETEDEGAPNTDTSTGADTGTQGGEEQQENDESSSDEFDDWYS